MNKILKLYQQRLDQLTTLFVRLLENIEKTKLFACSHTHSEYRFEYILTMIKTTLENNQQKTIRKLHAKITQFSGQSLCNSQLQSIKLQIPEILPKYMERMNQKAKEYTSPSTPKGKNSKHSMETKVNSCQSSQYDNQESSNNGSQYQQEILAYQFKYLKLRL